MHLKSLQRPNAASCVLRSERVRRVRTNHRRLHPELSRLSQNQRRARRMALSLRSATRLPSNAGTVKLVVGTGATWMLNLMFGAFLASSSSDDLNDPTRSRRSSRRRYGSHAAVRAARPRRPPWQPRADMSGMCSGCSATRHRCSPTSRETAALSLPRRAARSPAQRALLMMPPTAATPSCWVSRLKPSMAAVVFVDWSSATTRLRQSTLPAPLHAARPVDLVHCKTRPGANLEARGEKFVPPEAVSGVRMPSFIGLLWAGPLDPRTHSSRSTPR